MLLQVSRGEDPDVDQRKPGGGRRAKERSFERVMERFIRLHCQRHNKASTIRSTRRLLEKEFLTQWRNRDVAELSKGDILKVLDGIVDRGRPGAANHAYAAISKFFSWCSERDLIDTNPCTDVKRPAKLKARDRILTNRELAHIWLAAGATDYPFGPIVQLLALTGQRRGEVANMHWLHVDRQAAVWDIPKELTKSSRAHVVPLSQTAMSIIDELPRLHEAFLFPATGSSTTTFSGFGKCKKRFDQTCQVSDWTLHDLRRTAATGMAELGVAPHVVERVLNHSSGTFAGVAGVYNRFSYVDEMRAALELWEGKLRTLAIENV